MRKCTDCLGDLVNHNTINIYIFMYTNKELSLLLKIDDFAISTLAQKPV